MARYEHFQSATHMSVSFFAKGADRAASAVTLSPQGTELEARFVLPSGEPLFTCTLALLHPATSLAVTFTSMRCEAKLLKQTPGMWAALELPAGATRAAPAPAAAAQASAAKPSQPAQPAQPAAAGGGEAAAAAAPSAAPPPAKKNWSQLEKEIDAEEAAAKPEGEEALMQLFKGIYKDASDETRKAMIKSFQTSGGTVLSTNWKEVSETDYEKKAREEREGKGSSSGAGAK